jgi:hypothetical protein
METHLIRAYHCLEQQSPKTPARTKLLARSVTTRGYETVNALQSVANAICCFVNSDKA